MHPTLKHVKSSGAFYNNDNNDNNDDDGEEDTLEEDFVDYQASIPSFSLREIGGNKNDHFLGECGKWKLLAFGRNENGQLGFCKTKNRNVPSLPLSIPIDFVSSDGFSQVACGGRHSLGISENGGLYSWGWNRFAQLGLGDVTDRFFPCKVNSILFVNEKGPIPFLKLAAGSDHSLVLNSAGDVFSFGSGKEGQLGLGRNENQSAVPVMIPSLHQVKIEDISCGSCHCMALSSRGQVFTWGSGLNGRLGLGKSEDFVSRPSLVDGLKHYRVLSIACGWTHSMVVTDRSTIFSWGDGSKGKLGHGNLKNYYTPKCVDIFPLSGVFLRKIAAGNFHSVAIDMDHKLYFWGLLFDRVFMEPIEVISSSSIPTNNNNTNNTSSFSSLVLGDFSLISCGGSHTLITDCRGKLWVIGDNDSLQMGLTAENNFFSEEKGQENNEEIGGEISIDNNRFENRNHNLHHSYSGSNSDSESDQIYQVDVIPGAISISKFDEISPVRNKNLRKDSNYNRHRNNVILKKVFPVVPCDHVNSFGGADSLKVTAIAAGWWHSLCLVTNFRDDDHFTRLNMINNSREVNSSPIMGNIRLESGDLCNLITPLELRLSDLDCPHTHLLNNCYEDEKTKHKWLHDVLPHWDTLSTSLKVKQLVTKGIPVRLRAVVWKLLIGNRLGITSELFVHLKKMAINTKKDSTIYRMIEMDIPRTFTQLYNQPKTGPFYDDLMVVLLSWHYFRPDLGYVQGMSHICGMLLLHMKPEDAFISFANLLTCHFFFSFFRMDMQQILIHTKLHDQLFSESLPTLYDHFNRQDIRPEHYLFDWMMTAFANLLEFNLTSRLWDCWLCEGEIFLYRSSVALLKKHREGFLKGDFELCVSMLRSYPCGDFNDADELITKIYNIKVPSHLSKMASRMTLNLRTSC